MPERAPSKFEYDFLAFLAENEGLTSRELFEKFGRSQGYVRGTIVKALDRLHRKGLVRRELKEGVYVYYAVRGREDLEQNLVESFVVDRLGGRLAPLFNYFSEAGRIDEKDRKELRKLLEELDRQSDDA
jgi:predicted transcriptional regulator